MLCAVQGRTLNAEDKRPDTGLGFWIAIDNGKLLGTKLAQGSGEYYFVLLYPFAVGPKF